MEYVEYNNVPKSLLIFYLLISSSSLHNLLSKQWKNTLENSRIAQHTLGITTFLTLILLCEKTTIAKSLLYTIIGYLWFLIITKNDLSCIVIIISLLIGFVIFANMMQNKVNDITTDKVLSDNEKSNLCNNIEKKKIYCIIGMIVVSIVCSILYSNKKELQYKQNFNLGSFLLE